MPTFVEQYLAAVNGSFVQKWSIAAQEAQYRASLDKISYDEESAIYASLMKEVKDQSDNIDKSILDLQRDRISKIQHITELEEAARLTENRLIFGAKVDTQLANTQERNKAKQSFQSGSDRRIKASEKARLTIDQMAQSTAYQGIEDELVSALTNRSGSDGSVLGRLDAVQKFVDSNDPSSAAAFAGQTGRGALLYRGFETTSNSRLEHSNPQEVKATLAKHLKQNPKEMGMIASQLGIYQNADDTPTPIEDMLLLTAFENRDNSTIQQALEFAKSTSVDEVGGGGGTIPYTADQTGLPPLLHRYQQDYNPIVDLDNLIDGLRAKKDSLVAPEKPSPIPSRDILEETRAHYKAHFQGGKPGSAKEAETKIAQEVVNAGGVNEYRLGKVTAARQKLIDDLKQRSGMVGGGDEVVLKAATENSTATGDSTLADGIVGSVLGPTKSELEATGGSAAKPAADDQALADGMAISPTIQALEGMRARRVTQAQAREQGVNPDGTPIRTAKDYPVEDR